MNKLKKKGFKKLRLWEIPQKSLSPGPVGVPRRRLSLSSPPGGPVESLPPPSPLTGNAPQFPPFPLIKSIKNIEIPFLFSF